MYDIETIRDHLPPLVGVVPDLTPHAKGEMTSPHCPYCGTGVDRFIVFTEKDKFFCRHCQAKGDRIDYHKKTTGENLWAARQKKEQKLKPASARNQNLKASYQYQDETRKTLFTVDRYEQPGRKKTFRQWHIRDGKRINNTDGVRRVPYRLSLLLDSPEIYIVEGEKDADRLVSEGIPATCFMGAKWQDEYGQYFKGRTVFILPDNDGPGEILGRTIAKATGGKIVTLPGLPVKGDVSDWFDSGNTLEDFWKRVDAAKSVANEEIKAETITVKTSVADIMGNYEVKREYVDSLGREVWLYPDLVISGHILVIIAMTGGGKTTFLFYEVVPHMVKTGTEVYYIDADSPPSEHKAMKEFADITGFKFINPDTRIGKSVGDCMKDMRKMVDAGVDLSGCVFIFDTLKKFTDLMSKGAVKEFFSLCRTMNTRGATCIFSAHANKYRDKDGHLIPEGVGDVKNDADDLILFERQSTAAGGIDVTTVTDPDNGAKTRGIFKPFSFTITAERKILLSDKVINLPDFTATRAVTATDEEILDAAETLLVEIGEPVNKTTLARYVHDQMEGAGMKRIKRVITANSEIKGKDTTSNRRFSYTIGARGAQMMEMYRAPVQEDLFL